MSEETIGQLYDSLAARDRLPEELRGEQCTRCGTVDNVVWFTDSVFWNAVIRQGDYVEPALCIPCFVVATAERGYSPTGWRVVPEFHWETAAEYDARRAVPAGDPRDTPDRRQERALWLVDIATMLREQSKHQNHPEFVVAADWLDPPMVRVERELLATSPPDPGGTP